MSNETFDTGGSAGLTVDLTVQPPEISIDGQVSLTALPNIGPLDLYNYEFSVQTDPTGTFVPIRVEDVNLNVARWIANVATPRSVLARVRITRKTPQAGAVNDANSLTQPITVTQDLATPTLSMILRPRRTQRPLLPPPPPPFVCGDMTPCGDAAPAASN